MKKGQIKKFFKSELKVRPRIVLGLLFFFFLGFFLSSGEISLKPLYRIYNQLNGENILSWNVDKESSIVEESYNLLQKNYLYKDKVSSDLLLRTARYMIEQAYDEPYSDISGPEQNGYLGMTLDNKSGRYPEITHVIQGYPADKSGLEDGMMIEQIDGVDISYLPMSEILEMLKGEPNTEVTIKIFNNEQIFKATRVRAFIDSKLKFTDDIVEIYFPSFSYASLDSLKELIDSNKNELLDVKKVIFDLRDNVGGDIEVLKSVVSLFVPKDTYIIHQFNENDSIDVLANGDFEPYFQNAEVCILTSNITASSSEAFITALKDYLNITIYGDRTFGKNVITTYYPLQNNWMLKLVTYFWEGPNGESVEDGIESDDNIPDWCMMEQENK